MLKTEKADPSLAKPRIDIELPTCINPKTETADPHRATLRKDNADPRLRKSRTDKADPSRIKLLMDMVEPKDHSQVQTTKILTGRHQRLTMRIPFDRMFVETTTIQNEHMP